VVNGSKQPVPGIFFDGPFDPAELDRVQRLRLDRLFLGCQMQLLEKPA
jgi:hypothetical protein